MLTVLEQKELESMIEQWEDFKSMRRKKRFDFGETEGWLTMLKRESFLDLAIKLISKFKKMKPSYE